MLVVNEIIARTPSFPPRLRRESILLLFAAMLMLAVTAACWAQARPHSKLPPKLDLRPKLVPGDILHYHIQLQTVTDTRRTGAISDPQGPSRLTVTWGAAVKLEVLGIASAPDAPTQPAPAANKNLHSAEALTASAPLRIRTTYERSTATVTGDSPDPQAEDIEQKYKRLEGQVIEFTVGSDGKVTDVHGLDAVVDDDQVRKAAAEWMAQVSGPAAAPQSVVMGQTWNSAQSATSLPLAGMVWRSHSTYLRNEPCQPADPAGSASSAEPCAVILTRQSIVAGKKLRDPTPEDYRRNALHTSGRWNGSGESLSYISLRTHLAASVTQDSSQQIDFTVTNSAGRSIRYAGTIETHSHVELLPPASPESR